VGTGDGTGKGPEKKKIPLVARLVAAIALGALVGTLLGPRAAVLGEIGVLVIKLLKALATPLVFFAVVDSFCRAQIPAKKGAILIVICVVNAAVAGAIAIGLSALIAPGARTDVEALRGAVGGTTGASAPHTGQGAPAVPQGGKMDWLAALKDLIPESIPDPFLKNQVLTIVLLAVICGIALRTMRGRGSGAVLFKLIEEGFELLGVLLHGVVAIVPVAVFAVVAKVVGTTGFSIFLSLGALVGTVALGLAIHVLGYYVFLILVVARRSEAL
jgi:Na+/H+-dicarboxylate symporter